MRSAREVWDYLLSYVAIADDRASRIVSLGHSETLVTSSDDPRFHDMWQALISEKEAVCAHTGVRHTPMPKPRALIADVRAGSLET